MSAIVPATLDGPLLRQIAPGDSLLYPDPVFPTSDTTVNRTIVGADLLRGVQLRAPAGASADNFDSAANIIAAISNYLAVGGLPVTQQGSLGNGMALRYRIINTGAGAITVGVTANTGVTVNRGAVAAGATKEFSVQLRNITPVVSLFVTTTNTSAIVGGLTPAQTALVSVGQVVTSATAGLQGTTVIGKTDTTITLSGNANATNSTPVAITFSPVIVVEGLSN